VREGPRLADRVGDGMNGVRPRRVVSPPLATARWSQRCPAASERRCPPAALPRRAGAVSRPSEEKTADGQTPAARTVTERQPVAAGILQQIPLLARTAFR